MTTKRATSLPDRDDVFSRNTKIDANVVAAHERLEKDLKRLGVEIKPSYKLDSPWRRNRTRIHNRGPLTTANSNSPHSL